MRIILFGKTGQVGTSLIKKLSKHKEIYVYGRDECNFENPDSIVEVLNKIKPSIIINAAAYTNVDKAEDEKKRCDIINNKTVGEIADFSKHNNSLFIHFSTDYVFSGLSNKLYVETDETNPINTYGQTKLLGEKAILNSGCKYYILRTSWVVSRNGKSFISKMIELFSTKRLINVVDDQIGIPTTSDFISDIVIKLIDVDYVQSEIFNLTPNGETSWYKFAVYLYDHINKTNKNVARVSIEPILSVNYPTPAKRPKNSRLDSSKIQKFLGIQFYNWTKYIDEIID